MAARPPRLKRGAAPAAAARFELGPRGRVLAFLALYAGFTVLWQALADTVLLEAWIQRVVVPLAAAWLSPLSVALDAGAVLAEGPRLMSAQAALNVLPGCEGSDAMGLVAAALLVSPRSWAQRALGLVLLLAAVFALNQARLGGLLWVLAQDRTWFDRLHLVVLPLALVLASVGLVALWWRTSAPPGAAVQAAPTA